RADARRDPADRRARSVDVRILERPRRDPVQRRVRAHPPRLLQRVRAAVRHPRSARRDPRGRRRNGVHRDAQRRGAGVGRGPGARAFRVVRRARRGRSRRFRTGAAGGLRAPRAARRHARVGAAHRGGGVAGVMAPRRYAIARLVGLAVHFVEVLALTRLFPDVRLALALGMAGVCRLVGAIAGTRPARATGAVALASLAVCLVVVRLYGGPPGALDVYAVVCAARLALQVGGRLDEIEAGLAPGPLLVVAPPTAAASLHTLVVVHLLAGAFAVALTWPRAVDPASVAEAAVGRLAPTVGAVAWLVGQGMVAGAGAGVDVVAAVVSLPAFLAAGQLAGNRLRRAAADRHGDLSVTALYTSGAWSWGRLPGAELLASREAQ